MLRLLSIAYSTFRAVGNGPFRGVIGGLLSGVLFAGCASANPEIAKGKQLFTDFQCATCHNVTGEQSVTGPTLKGLAGSVVSLDDGSTAVADESFLRESILRPNARVRKGWFPDQMLTVSGRYQRDLEDPENLNALVAYIESVK